MVKTVRYQGGYKYQLVQTYRDQIPIFPAVDIEIWFISLSTGGDLEIRFGYAWDGPSGPTIDTPSFMRGSLVHDALCQLMRMGLLDRQIWTDPAARLLQTMCVQDGMWKVRAWWVYQGLAVAGAGATLAENRKVVLVAP